MRRILSFLLLCAAFLSCGGGFSAHARLRDSTAFSNEKFVPKKLAAPGILLGAGALGVSWDVYKENINIPAKDFADELRGRWGKIPVDDYLQYAPIAAYVGLGALGRGDHRFVEHFAAGATAYATMGLLVNGLKYTVCEMRPDGSRRNSFPSGHTATAFMGAELVRLEYGGWWGAGAYTVASAVALLRVYNCRHWVNDLLGGAAIGILSANVGYWLLPLERRWFGISSRGDMAVLPFAIPAAASSGPVPGLSIACEF